MLFAGRCQLRPGGVIGLVCPNMAAAWNLSLLKHSQPQISIKQTQNDSVYCLNLCIWILTHSSSVQVLTLKTRKLQLETDDGTERTLLCP